MIEAAIDIGTNTMLLLAAEVSGAPGSRKLDRIVADESTYVRLGEGVHQNREFAAEPMRRALKCFKEYREICDKHGVEKIYATATSASRDSKNAVDFYRDVLKKTGIRVQIIDGKHEAKLSFLGGLLPFQDPTKSAILDIGGGSTEFVVLDPATKLTNGHSFDMGSVRATEMFLKGDPYTKPSLEALEKHLSALWPTLDAKLQTELRAKEWTAIAGTPTTLAAMTQKLTTFAPEKIDGYRLERCLVADWYESLATQKQAQRAANPWMSSGRADIMVAGVAILLTAMEFFGKEDVVVSTRGLRYGVLIDPPSEKK